MLLLYVAKPDIILEVVSLISLLRGERFLKILLLMQTNLCSSFKDDGQSCEGGRLQNRANSINSSTNYINSKICSNKKYPAWGSSS